MALSGKKSGAGGSRRAAAEEQPVAPLRRGLKPGAPRERNYKYKEQGKPSSGGNSDDLTIRADKKNQVELIRPDFKAVLPTVFRPFPMLCAEDPSRFDPYRFSVNKFDFGDHVRSYPAAKYIGKDEKYTFLLYTKGDKATARNHPYLVFFYTIQDADKKGTLPTPKWNPLIRQDSREKIIAPPADLTFLQGALFQHRTSIYFGDGKMPKGLGSNDSTHVLQLPKSAGQLLMDELNAIRDDYDGDTEGDLDWERAMVNGDPFDLNHGRFIYVFNPETAGLAAAGATTRKTSPADEEEVDLDPSMQTGGREQHQSRKDTPRGYSLYLDTHYHVPGLGKRVSARLPKYERTIASKLQWWDDILHVPGLDETLELMAKAFRSVPKMLEFGWREHPEFFTSDVRGILGNRTQGPGAELPSDEDEFSAEEEADLGFEEEEIEEEAPRGRRAAGLNRVDELNEANAVAEEEAEPIEDEEPLEDEEPIEDEDVLDEEPEDELEAGEELDAADELEDEEPEAELDEEEAEELAAEEDEYEDEAEDEGEEQAAEQDEDAAQAEMDAALEAARSRAARRGATAAPAKPAAIAKTPTKSASRPAAAPGKPAGSPASTKATAKPGNKPAAGKAAPAKKTPPRR